VNAESAGAVKPAQRLRVLFIARYRSAAMERKLAWMRMQADLDLCLVRPALWEDEYGRADLPNAVNGYRTLSIPMLGRPSDPHRATYRTLTFDMLRMRPAIVHAEEEPDSISALQIALARRIFCPKALLFLHTWQNVDRPKTWYVRAVTRLSLRAADAIFCANQGAVDLLHRMGFHGPTPLIPAIGVDTDLFTLRPERLHPESATIGYIGRFTPEKGIITLIDAFQRVQQAMPQRSSTLRLIGGGPQQAELTSYVAQSGLQEKVVFVPSQPPEEIVHELHGLDALVLPSLSTPVWQEQLGRVMLEAMACGIPVIGSDSGAIPEVIGDAGQIFPEGNAAELAKCIERLLADADLRQQCIARGAQRAREQYSQQILAAKTIAFYRQVLS
jgi:glycosyltransferase involved in cell wall biosynthesis